MRVSKWRQNLSFYCNCSLNYRNKAECHNKTKWVLYNITQYSRITLFRLGHVRWDGIIIFFIMNLMSALLCFSALTSINNKFRHTLCRKQDKLMDSFPSSIIVWNNQFDMNKKIVNNIWVRLRNWPFL